MSLTSKVFLGTSLVSAGAVVYGVHYLQKREQDTMYQGVIKDEVRTRNKATAAAAARLQTASEGATIIPSISSSGSIPPLNTPGAPIQRSYEPQPIASTSTSTSASIPSSTSSSSWWSSASAPVSSPDPVQRFDEDDPLTGVGVAQPPPLVDEDCATCIISPPPQLSEAQTREQRRRDRQDRLAEYEAQKKLAGRLELEQGVHEPQGRLV